MTNKVNSAGPVDKARSPISEGSDWTFELIDAYDREIGLIAEEFGMLD